MQIDLKNVILKIQDGKAVATTAEIAGAVSIGATTVTLATGGVAAEGLAVGDWISPDSTGFRPRYWIKKIATDTLTLDRPVTEAWADEAVFGKSDVNELELDLGEGNVTWSVKPSHEYRLSKRALSTVYSGDEQPLDVSFDFVWEYLTQRDGGTGALPYEALQQIGAAAAYVSSGNECEPYAVDIVLLNNPTCASQLAPNEMYIFPQFRPDDLPGDLTGAAISVSGRCNVLRPIVIRY